MKFLTDEKSIKEADHFMEIAAEESLKSNCRKSKRGVVLVNNGLLISKGYNEPLLPELCCVRENIHDNRSNDLCSALHAEQMAIANASKGGYIMQKSRLYHIKVDGGKMVASGSPSCTLCSKLIYAVGISEVVLLHEKGYALYGAEEFNRLSFDYHLKNKAR